MISDQMIAKCVDDVKQISGCDLLVMDGSCRIIAGSLFKDVPDRDTTASFISQDDSERTEDGYLYIRIPREEGKCLVLLADADNEVYARLAASLIGNVIEAANNRVDRDSFFRNLLLGNLFDVDIYGFARKLHIEDKLSRCVFIIEPVAQKDPGLIDMVKELFYTEAGDHVTALDEDRVIVIRALSENEGKSELAETADMLVDMAGSEASRDVRVAYGTVAGSIKELASSYREAKMALDVGKIFYPMKRSIEYSNLGVGRLIYQLPVDLCRLFVKEIFGDDIPDEIDDEVLTTVNRFFDNSLNVSETSRQLFIHRNTLIYRIEKLQKATGLDVRVFDDALTLKIALMVVNYLKYTKG
ncbi:MAG: helix-turn-helix domain-containing protein [Lachnospiraceae bacterium]|nr:helix-turn-helix domain-containing protein [Lachnospiraceae bacterium]